METDNSDHVNDTSLEDHRIKSKLVHDPIELELVLIRHGSTQWNKERRYLGCTDLPLLPVALQQLSAIRGRSALSGEFWRVCCSDLRRCRETLAAAAPALEHQAIYDSRLREMDFGAWEGCTYEQLKDNKHYRSWIDDPESVTPPGGEAWEEFAGRIDNFWTQLQREAVAAVAAGVVEVAEVEAESVAVESVAGSVTPLIDADSMGPGGCNAKTDASEPESAQGSAILRVLLVTHGGVIRQLLARIVEGMTFYTAAAPAPGEVTVMNLRRHEGIWSRIAR
ncbi:histidine phosphatase family protein [Paenibacillus riograndensis]|uniref:histidine phosphatase family protein n=1 Tax=Paenibacillus riograndensis TaxID=483937 RepID=UPI000764CBC0|nr:histidine phosphatase family protein [Paenibacillus riograndensis]